VASYAGAVAAIQQRLRDNWTATPIAFQNGAEPGTTDVNGNPVPWVYCEVLNTGSEIRGIGTPGDHVWLYFGLIHLHVFVPVGSGDALAQTYAVQLGEIFRAAGFYSDGTGNIVRTISPQTDGGDTASDDGLWWRVTCTVPFEFYYRDMGGSIADDEGAILTDDA